MLRMRNEPHVLGPVGKKSALGALKSPAEAIVAVESAIGASRLRSVRGQFFGRELDTNIGLRLESL
jgi:hypothetical protein